MQVILIMAQSLDGFISRTSDDFIDWTGHADKKMFVDITKDAGAVIMGCNTFNTTGQLPDRLNIVYTRQNYISNTSELLYTSSEPKKLLEDLKFSGYSKVALIGGSQINSLFLNENLITDFYITIVPLIFGTGLSLFRGFFDKKLNFVSMKKLDEEIILLHYQRDKKDQGLPFEMLYQTGTVG